MITVSDTPITTLVRDVMALEGTLAPAVAVRNVLPLANAAGVFGAGVTVAPRSIVAKLDVFPATTADRATLTATLLQNLGGLRPLRTDDAPRWEHWVTLTNVRVDLYYWPVLRCAIELTFTAADPTRYEVDAVAIGLSTSRATCPIGALPSAPRVYIYGACTDPAIIARNASGDETHRLSFTGTLASTDYLDVDGALQTVDRYVSGVRQTGTGGGNAWVTSGTFPILAPEDTSFGGGITIALAAASGTPTGLIVYQRGY